jgi:hypothetical protein
MIPVNHLALHWATSDDLHERFASDPPSGPLAVVTRLGKLGCIDAIQADTLSAELQGVAIDYHGGLLSVRRESRQRYCR